MHRSTRDIGSPSTSHSPDRSNRLRAMAFGLLAAAGLFLASAAPSLAQNEALPAGFKTEPVLKTAVTRDGAPIAYAAGKPEIISVIGTIEPGGRTPLHQHPVPVYVYVLEGELELRTEGGEPHRYNAGEAYIEALDRNHQLFNVGGTPAKVLVVFMGQEGSPTTVAAK